jgi:hypothetical protein
MRMGSESMKINASKGMASKVEKRSSGPGMFASMWNSVKDAFKSEPKA